MPENFDEKIVEWIAIKYLPFNFFDDEETQSFFKYFNKNIALPKRTSLKNKVDKHFDRVKEIVLKIVSGNSSNISFTIDGWTSVSHKSYYGITAHYIDDDWKLQSLVIDFVPANGRHTGNDIAKIFYKTVCDYKLQNKIQGIVVDNAAANTSFIAELRTMLHNDGIYFNSEDSHFHCFAHILNLGVQDIMKILCPKYDDCSSNESDTEFETEFDVITESTPIIVKLRQLFIKIKRSEQWTNKLYSCCDAVNIKRVSPLVDVATRWNSTYDMVFTAIRLRSALSALCDNNEELHIYKFKEVHWEVLIMVCTYLKPFKKLSTLLGGDKYITLPFVVVGFNLLVDTIEKFTIHLDTKPSRNAAEDNIITAFRTGRDKLLKHYKKTNWIYCAALILDPRHKIEAFNFTAWGKELKESSLNKFEEIYKTKYQILQDAPLNPIQTINEDEEMEDAAAFDMGSFYRQGSSYQCQGMSMSWRKEIDSYISENSASEQEDILGWWQSRQSSFPSLSKMSRDILSIPATSVPSERLFSKAGLIIRKHRNRLTPESATSLLCLNSWYSCSLTNKIKEKLSHTN